MRQQINLYQDILIDRPEPFRSRQVSVLLILFVVCLGLIGLYCYWQVNQLDERIDGLRQQQQDLAQQVAELEEQYPVRKPDVLLAAKIRSVEGSILGQRQALAYFSEQDQQQNKNILASLEGLARYPQKGLWLRRVSLLQAGREVQLSGSALTAEKVPEYLHLLGEKNIFAGQVFSHLQLKRIQDRGHLIDFELDSVKGRAR
ncbi:Fimbrial assembly protein (PilN) [Desulfuromusa kysingii]|uniref:Fimbrial assembly protein (PilN) n=1 Tax=Desulfuromusa kysingii TaxID=37625 RepID=A0A1H3WVM0_9BACT|nr:PilN domain-containing protein [Desulfuromusa kysingii]SDZ90414.1 Fimbrial assembly protein (PilN) [Desulfuromusa kysingii]